MEVRGTRMEKLQADTVRIFVSAKSLLQDGDDICRSDGG